MLGARSECFHRLNPKFCITIQILNYPLKVIPNEKVVRKVVMVGERECAVSCGPGTNSLLVDIWVLTIVTIDETSPKRSKQDPRSQFIFATTVNWRYLSGLWGILASWPAGDERLGVNYRMNWPFSCGGQEHVTQRSSCYVQRTSVNNRQHGHNGAELDHGSLWTA